MLEAGGQGGTYAPQPLLLALQADSWPPHCNLLLLMEVNVSSSTMQSGDASPDLLLLLTAWDMPAFYSTQVPFLPSF